MKAIATQTLILLILIATFVTLSIPSLIEEIKINRTTTTTPWITTTQTTSTIIGEATTTYPSEYKDCREIGGTCCADGCAAGVQILERGSCPSPSCAVGDYCNPVPCCNGPCKGTTVTTIPGKKCTDSDNGISPTVKGTTSGINGTYIDYCTSDGNLVEYYCEILPCPMYPCQEGRPCPGYPCGVSGYVLSKKINCISLCQYGACPDLCPEYNEVLKYTYIREDGMKVKLESENEYSCLLSYDSGGDKFDCKKDIYVDMEVAVQFPISTEIVCAEEFTMSIIGVNVYGDRGTCTYKCVVVL